MIAFDKNQSGPMRSICASSEEPGVVVPHAGICEGGAEQLAYLPQSAEIVINQLKHFSSHPMKYIQYILGIILATLVLSCAPKTPDIPYPPDNTLNLSQFGSPAKMDRKEAAIQKRLAAPDSGLGALWDMGRFKEDRLRYTYCLLYQKLGSKAAKKKLYDEQAAWHEHTVYTVHEFDRVHESGQQAERAKLFTRLNEDRTAVLNRRLANATR